MAQTHFFAAGDDLKPVMLAVEAKEAVVYALGKSSLQPVTDTFSSGDRLVGLGRASGDQQTACDRYLVLPASTPVVAREIRQSNGIVRYAFDQMINPDSIELTPGGEWGTNVVIGGRVGTCTDSPPSKSLLRLFRNALRRYFVGAGSCYVGPRAVERFRSGWRLTHAVQSPLMYDLASIPGEERGADAH